MRSPLAKVKHLGSAKNGTSTHIMQRATAVFLVPLLIWFVVTSIMIFRTPIDNLPWFLTSPVTIVGAVLFIGCSLYHGAIGMQIVIEDYIHSTLMKQLALLVLWGFVITTIVAGFITVLTVYILLRI